MSALSVCIPAFDEEHSIASVLRRASAEPPGVVAEILVCANGCTDRTEEVVRGRARQDPRVRLVSSPPGKARAWNALFAAAGQELAAFCDAHDCIEPGAFGALRDALLCAPRAAVAAGVEIPDPGNGAGRLWALANQPFGHDYLSGRLYAVRREVLGDLLRAAGFVTPSGPALPEDLLHEDLFLEVLAGSGMLLAPRARVRFRAGSATDLIRYRARISLARRQVSERWPDAYRSWARRRGTLALRRLPGRIASLLSAGTLLPSLAGLAVRGLALPFAGSAARALSMEASAWGPDSVMRRSGRLASTRGAR